MGNVVHLRNPGMEKMNTVFERHWHEVADLLDEESLDHWLVAANNFHLAIEMLCRVAEVEERDMENLEEFVHKVVELHFADA